MFETILVCLDGSKRAEQILPYVSAQASRFHSRVILLQVVPEPMIVSPGIPGAEPVPVVTESLMKRSLAAEAEARFYLEQTAEPMRKDGLQVDIVTMPGPPGPAITSYAESNKVDLIAMATHGRSGLRRAVLGSVADYVLRSSGLPILVIKPREIRSTV